MERYDYLIVGAGLFGCVFAYEAKKAGKKCLVIDKRPHIAGNIFMKNKEDVYKRQILGLVVGGIHVVGLRPQTGFHDRDILIGQEMCIRDSCKTNSNHIYSRSKDICLRSRNFP